MPFKVIGAGALFVAIMAGAVFFSFGFVEDERARQLQAWQIRLSIVADSRAAAVNEWVDQNFAALRVTGAKGRAVRRRRAGG